MKWENNLENLESSIENKKEKQYEQTQMIETKKDLYNQIQKVIKSYYILIDLKELGEEVEEAMKITDKRITELITLGIKYHNLTKKEIQSINTTINKATKRHI
ncbi:MAG: hypothetical protein IKF19_01455 [Bacilli bacterium]|nr:hypothetical protein [Bacilli bacterium]